MNAKRLCTLCFIMAVFFLIFNDNTAASPNANEKKAGALPEPVVHHPDTASIQTDTDRLAPGLAVTYHEKKMRHLDELAKDKKLASKAWPGKPILFLDHNFGEGEIFDSGKKQAVFVLMTGFVRFAQTGRYSIQANSNDGIRIFVTGRMIVNDPDVHAERLSVPGVVVIDKPGWYPVLIQYFQRKGTAALQLFWKVPGSEQYTIIPAAVYAHLPATK